MLRPGKIALAFLGLFALWPAIAATQSSRGGPVQGEAGGTLSGQTARDVPGSERRSILVRAIQLHQAGNFAEAIPEYQRYLAQDPDNFVARANLGAALAHEGRYAEAIEEYEKALRVQPANAELKLNLALAYYKASKLRESTRELLPLHAAKPGDLQIGLLLGDCYFRMGEFRKAVELLEPLEAAHPRERALDYLLGSALIDDGQVAKGQALVDKILRDGDSAGAHLMLGETRLRVHDTPGAIDELSRALQIDPEIPLVHSLYGQALLQSGHRSEAMQAFKEELAIDPNEFDPNLYLGGLLNEGQQYKEALPYLGRALQVRPGAPEVSYQIAIAQIGFGNLEQARQTLEALVKVSPSFVEAHVSLARVYYRLHRKHDGDKERSIIGKLSAEAQARKRAEGEKAGSDGTVEPPVERPQGGRQKQ